jgi:hypothetical protein
MNKSTATVEESSLSKNSLTTSPQILGICAVFPLVRMKQFYETYKDNQILSTLLRELSWSNNLLVMSRAKIDEERLFLSGFPLMKNIHIANWNGSLTLCVLNVPP